MRGTEWQPRNTPAWADANFAQVNIGRNAGKVPLDDFEWSTFLIGVKDACQQISGTRSQVMIIKGLGVGHWLGVPEEAAAFMVTFPLLNEKSVERFEDEISALRKEFQQDAISVIYGTSRLVTE
jgi:hypothetical protein